MATKVSLLTNFIKIEAPEDTYYVNASTLSVRFKGSNVIISDPGTDISAMIAFTDFQDGDSNPYTTEATISAYLGSIAGGNVTSGSIGETELDPKYKGITTIAALDVDWDDSFAYEKTLTANTTFTFSNLYIGVKTLIIDGNYTVAFPTGFTLTNGSEAYDGTKTNLIEVICWDTSTPEGLVNITYSV
jgi:hypothetical protein